MLRIKSDKIILDNTLFDGYVYVENGKIVDVTRDERDAEECYDFTGKYVSPGFIDTHTHGACGCGFYLITPEQLATACNYHLFHGTTTILPTVFACPHKDTKETIKTFLAAKEQGLILSNAPGVHIEGPYLNVEQCGGQPPQYITPPIKEDYEEMMTLYGDAVKRWTYAPEYDKDGEFCRYITERGVIASAGHSNAKYDDMCTAIENGCNLVTHLYSCTSTVTRDHGFRSLGVIESTYLRDELYAEMIADGKHLPPDLIRMIEEREVRVRELEERVKEQDAVITEARDELRLRRDKADEMKIRNTMLADRITRLEAAIERKNRTIAALSEELYGEED